MAKYLALDQSLRTSGYAVFNEDETLVTYGNFTTKPSQGVGSRLLSIIDNIGSLIKEHEIDYILLEDIQNQANNQTYARLAYVQGIIFCYCAEKDIAYKVLSSSHWRKIIKDNYGITFGRTRVQQKEVAINFVKDHFDKNVTSDEADAICLGLAGIIESKKLKNAF